MDALSSSTPKYECSICFEDLDPYTNGCQENIKPACEHIFHAKCLKGWQDKEKATCPLCRNEIKKAPEDPLFQMIDLHSTMTNLALQLAVLKVQPTNENSRKAALTSAELMIKSLEFVRDRIEEKETKK